MQSSETDSMSSIWRPAFSFHCAVAGILVVGLLANQVAAQPKNRVRIRAQQIITMEGDVISPGELLVQDGKIAFVGESIELSLPARELEVHTLMPGIINASSSVGLTGGSAEISREITPEFNTVSAIDWRSRDFAEALDQGVTVSQVLPATDSVFCGYACLVKSAGDPQSRVIDAERSVVIAVCSDPTSRNRSRSRPDSIYVRQPTNRMGVVWIIRDSLNQARQQDSGRIDSSTLGILSDMLERKVDVISVSRTDFDIRSAFELGSEFGFQPVIYGGDEVYRMIDEFEQADTPLVYTALTTGATASALRGAEGTELRWNVPGRLQEAGISFCLAGDDLLDQARFAVRYGLPPTEALKAITQTPAEILKIADQVGSISAGKQADIVALSGDPLQPTSAVQWAMVDGEIYGNESEQ